MNPNLKKMLAGRAISNKGLVDHQAREAEAARVWALPENVEACKAEQTRARNIRYQMEVDIASGMSRTEAVRHALNAQIGINRR